MKKLWNKIHINPLTYIVLCLSLIAGYVKFSVVIFFILLIHEFGHLFACKLFRKKVESITILPFGGIIKIHGLVSDSIVEELILSSAGIAFQAILGFFLLFFNDNKLCEAIEYYNKLIIIFNLLPICPLDGYNIFKCLIELFIPIKYSLNLSNLVSLSILILLCLMKIDIVQDNALILTYILFKTIEEYKTNKYLMNKYYLERVLYDFNYNIINITSKDKMFRNKKHIINGIDEKKYLLKVRYSRK